MNTNDPKSLLDVALDVRQERQDALQKEKAEKEPDLSDKDLSEEARETTAEQCSPISEEPQKE